MEQRVGGAEQIIRVTQLGLRLLPVVRRHPLSAAVVAGFAILYGMRHFNIRTVPTAGRLEQMRRVSTPNAAAVAAPTRHARLSSSESSRGRSAENPEEIPARGWRDVLTRVKSAIGSDHVSLVAAGLAMYALLAVFPALAAAVSLYGLFAAPADVIEHMKTFAAILPPGTFELFSNQLQAVAAQGQGALTLSALAGIAVALWSARSGMAALMTATNIAYAETEKRGFIRQTLLSLLFTLAAIVGFLIVLAVGVGLPVVLKALGTSHWVQWLIGALRWVALWFIAVLGLAVVYRYAPSRRRPRWRWVTWGSIVAATLWILMSVAFSGYVSSFASYNKTYGTLGGVIALLMWFYLSSFVIVVGAEINAEMERQTRRDTTSGPEAPLGERGAYAADTVGPSSDAQSGRAKGRRNGERTITERGRERLPSYARR